MKRQGIEAINEWETLLRTEDDAFGAKKFM